MTAIRSAPISVLIADDQDLLRSGLQMILERAEGIDVVGAAAEGSEAVALARQHHPDVVLMDIRMQGMDGIEATRRITAEAANTRVVVLTTYDLDDYLYRAVHAGASGFLLKTAPPESLIAAIRSVLDGDVLLAPEITRRLLEAHVRRPPPGVGVSDDRLGSLTERETEVLKLIAQGRSNSEIGASLFLSTPTVKSHVNRLFRKLAVRDRVQAIVLAYETGLVTPGDPTEPDAGR